MDRKKRKPLPLRAEDFFGLAPLPRGETGGIWHSFLRFLRKGGPKTGRGDAGIQEVVSRELAHHPVLHGSRISSRVEKGVVTLSGTVSDRWSKRLAERAVENVRGVRRVRNELGVRGWNDRQRRQA